MTLDRTPTLDQRQATQILAELLQRRPAYLPDWTPVLGQRSQALLQIYARMMQTIIDRLNQAPDKNMLAFLDMMGLSLIPAQAARAPVVFQSLPNVGNGQVPGGIQVGAQSLGQPGPLTFETERTIAMTAAQLVEVKSVWPTRDEYADHTNEWAGGRTFSLFKPGQPIPHEFYLAHDTLFALTGQATVQLEFELARPGSLPLDIAWTHWDGQVWRPFSPLEPDDPKTFQDGTEGLTRSGTITLRAECGPAKKKTIDGVNAHWLRGQLNQPLPPDPTRVLPEVDRLRVRSVIEQPLQNSILEQIDDETDRLFGCFGGLQPDQAFAGTTQLDLSTIFNPFGKSPDNDTIFYFSSEEIFSKAGARVSLCFDRVRTPEEEADEQVPDLEKTFEEAKATMLTAAQSSAASVRDSAQVVLDLPTINTIKLTQAVNELKLEIANFSDMTRIDTIIKLVKKVISVIEEDVLVNPNFFGGILTSVGVIQNAVNEAHEAALGAKTVLQALSDLNPADVALADKIDTVLSPPRLDWEYWDGHHWQRLAITSLDGQTVDFQANTEISFIVPQNLEPRSVNGTEARWIRVRIASGSYNHLRLVSWFDAQSDYTNFFPIIEPRPPALTGFYLGYSYRSPWERPQHCHSHNDFQVEVHSQSIRWPGNFFPPFRPMSDMTPALYFGFDRPLPNDLVSLYLDIKESQTSTPPLIWDVWDGTDWRETTITDETAALQRPGMISFIAPNVAPRPQVVIEQASNMQIVTRDALETAIFQPSDQVTIQQDDTAELGIVIAVNGPVIQLETPLAETYTGGTMSLAALPRFGTSRDWLRARLKFDGAPAESQLNGIHLNAAWAVQRQTISNEVLGSSRGEPEQVFFFIQTPILPGEVIEVRELQGNRAAIEYPILHEELLRQGLTEDDIRIVPAPRTGEIVEVWVRWQSRPHLYFSGPDDRHYLVEQARGRLIFGDGRHGRIPMAGANNIQARQYQAGGGVAGNVPAGAINQVLGAAPFVQEVTNPRAAEGGANGELLTTVKVRGPQTLRHRGRSLAARDYEGLAREASPGIAAARALPATAPNGRPAAGWVTIIIVPQSQEARPQPSYELRRQVHAHLIARTPATVAPEQIGVIGPTYLPIGVLATVIPLNPTEAGLLRTRLEAALADFLHPLSGGPAGDGWPFGRDVYLSDLAALVEGLAGVDYAAELNLLLNNTPQGERIVVPPDRIIVAGPILVDVQPAEY